MIHSDTEATPRADLGQAFQEYWPNNMDFVAAECLPPLEVVEEAAYLDVIMRENVRLVEDKHADGDTFGRVGLEKTDLSYACVDRGLETLLTDKQRGKYRNRFDAEVLKVQHLKLTLLMGREYRAAAALLNTTTFTGADLYKDNSGDPWDAAAADIIGQVDAAVEKVRQNTGVRPDSIVFGAAHIQSIRKNTAIKAQFPGAQVITKELMLSSLPNILGLRNVYIGGAAYNSADQGQTYSGADIWGDDYALVFKKHEGGLSAVPGLGRILWWAQLGAADPIIETYREEQRKGDVFRSRLYDQEKLFDAYFGHLMKIDA